MKETARRASVATLVVGGLVILALALWKLRIMISLLFLAFIIAAAMRPGVEFLKARRIPRGMGIAIHYVGLAVVVGLLLWAVVPRAKTEVQTAVDALGQVKTEAQQSEGIRRRVLLGLERRIEELPSGSSLVDPAVTVTVTVFEVLVGIFFTLACAAYWIFEREQAQRLVLSLLPVKRRRIVRETWDLIDLKLGAFVRGQLLLVVLVATVLSFAFWVIGLPYPLLVGIFAGLVELVPVIGPLAAGVAAIGIGFTVSWPTALAAGIAVLAVRLLEDYIVIPRVLGDAVGLSPLIVLVSVSAVVFLFGGFAVLLAIPLAATLATLVDVIIRNRDPSKEEPPAVLFPAKDAEG
ncbi:MAG TPA: AI-2E family transporter [Gaiellaceae bacterium]|jgi:predicted PurR-regulated permease PerM